MAVYQQLSQSAITVGGGVKNTMVFDEGLTQPVRCDRVLDVIHPHQSVEFVTEHVGEDGVATTLDGPVIEIVVAFLLIIAAPGLEHLIVLMGVEYSVQFVDLGLTRTPGSQSIGHAFQELAGLVKLDQLDTAQRYHSRPDIRHPHQQAQAFQAVDHPA